MLLSCSLFGVDYLYEVSEYSQFQTINSAVARSQSLDLDNEDDVYISKDR